MKHALGIDIGSTTVKVTVINESHDILFPITNDILQILKELYRPYYLRRERKAGQSHNPSNRNWFRWDGNLRTLTYSILSGSSLCGECLTGL